MGRNQECPPLSRACAPPPPGASRPSPPARLLAPGAARVRRRSGRRAAPGREPSRAAPGGSGASGAAGEPLHWRLRSPRRPEWGVGRRCAVEPAVAAPQGRPVPRRPWPPRWGRAGGRRSGRAVEETRGRTGGSGGPRARAGRHWKGGRGGRVRPFPRRGRPQPGPGPGTSASGSRSSASSTNF